MVNASIHSDNRILREWRVLRSARSSSSSRTGSPEASRSRSEVSLCCSPGQGRRDRRGRAPRRAPPAGRAAGGRWRSATRARSRGASRGRARRGPRPRRNGEPRSHQGLASIRPAVTAFRSLTRASTRSRPTKPWPGAGSPARSWRKSSSKTERNPWIGGQLGFGFATFRRLGSRTAQPLPSSGGSSLPIAIDPRSPRRVRRSRPRPRAALASQTIARNATNVHLAVNRNKRRAAHLPRRRPPPPHARLGRDQRANSRRGACKQISFKLDYSGGWGSRRKDLWRGFKNACQPVRRSRAQLRRRRLQGA